MADVRITPQKKNIQGLVLRGYTHPYSCHLLFTFPAAMATEIGADTQAFFRALYPQVQNACDWGDQKPAQFLNVGLTYNGIVRLAVLPESELNTFPSEFRAGPWSSDSQGSLGDTAASMGAGGAAHNPSDPSNWWGRNFANADLHCIIHAYALTQDDLTALTTSIAAAAAASGVQELYPRAGSQERLTQYQLPDDTIHFGYRDGISEPRLARSNGNPYSFRRESDLANFLIGYCPQVALVPPAPAPPASGTVGVAAAAFAHDGCYNAFRIMYQDVAAFNSLLAGQAPAVAQATGLAPAAAQEWLAAKLMGRWRNGSPLLLSPDNPEESTRDGEGFCYVQPPVPGHPPLPNDDMFSTFQCPFAAHTRITNPRDEHLTAANGLAPPRLARRGMPYGAPLTTPTDDGVDRGLIGLFLCGSLANQFELLYGWINQANFASSFPIVPKGQPHQYTYPQDAILGNRVTQGTDINTSFTIPLPGSPALVVESLPRLTITRGTAYCLLPSLTTLSQLAGC
jgi:deferrochelatase/peroxidase EfeB